MNDKTDLQLLRDYAENRSEEAFTFLVNRHVDFVYSAARRMAGDSHLAEDVTQSVFIALAQNAPRLIRHPVLSGWLHRTAQNIAAQTVRTNVRRHTREQEAVAMNELLSVDPGFAWEDIAPHLDTALGELSEPDRAALFLRFFERQSAREMAQTLGVSDEAAQKRVNRAVERLRTSFAKQGFTCEVGGLVALISANAVQAAPVGLAAAISTAVALSGTTVATTSTTAIVTKAITMTTLQKALVAATIVAVGFGIYEAVEMSSLRHEIRLLQKQNTEKITQLTNERNRILKEQESARKENERLSQNTTELLQLRGKVGVMQRQLAAAQLASEKKALPDEEVSPVTNAPAVYSAKVQTQLKWDHAVAIGGWKIPSGKRMFYFAEPKREINASQVLVKLQTLACSDEVARRLGLENILTDSKEILTSSPLTVEQNAMLATPQDTARAGMGPMHIETMQIATLGGRQAQMMTSDGTLNVLPTITADGESVNMAIEIALTPHDPVPE